MTSGTDEWLMQQSLKVRWPSGRNSAFTDLQTNLAQRVQSHYGKEAADSLRYVARHREFSFETRTIVHATHETDDSNTARGFLVLRHSVRTFEPLGAQFRKIDALTRGFVVHRRVTGFAQTTVPTVGIAATVGQRNEDNESNS